MESTILPNQTPLKGQHKSPAQQLLDVAQQAPADGRYSWKEHEEAVRMLRMKRWSWPKIYAQMASLGLAPANDSKTMNSFRTAMIKRLAKNPAKA